MLAQLDPDCGYEQWFKSLMAVYHETGGSEEGFALANEWSARGCKYCGERKLRAKWRSFGGFTGKPITAGTIRHYVAQQGKDIAEICAATEPFEVQDEETVVVDMSRTTTPTSHPVAEPAPGPGALCDAPVVAAQTTAESDVEATLELFLAAFSITGRLPELRREMIEAQYVLDGIALMGQATVLYAAPNTGKTLLVLWLLMQAIRMGRVDPARVFYLNCDDTLAGLLQKAELAAAHGFHMLADGYQGFETRDLQKNLSEVIRLKQARGSVIVLDTLKKFTDLMDKRASTKFMKLIRKFVIRGGTVIMLAHANKNPGPDGRPVYAGVADVLDDADCGYMLWVSSEPAAAERTVEFERMKGRGYVRRSVTFAYSGREGMSYDQLLASVRQVASAEADEQPVEIELPADAQLVGAAKACIREGIVLRMKLRDAVAQRTGCSRRKAHELLDRYSGLDLARCHWIYDVQARGAKVYRLLEAAPDADASETAAADSTEGADHE